MAVHHRSQRPLTSPRPDLARLGQLDHVRAARHCSHAIWILLTAINNRRSRNFLHGCQNQTAAHVDENRRASRRRVLKSATIEFDRGAHSCAVRNLSEAGAALDVPYALAIPHEFKLIMETDQVSRYCRVVWRKDQRLGVAFEIDNEPQL